jgi:hypothetical protein
MRLNPVSMLAHIVSRHWRMIGTTLGILARYPSCQPICAMRFSEQPWSGTRSELNMPQRVSNEERDERIVLVTEIERTSAAVIANWLDRVRTDAPAAQVPSLNCVAASRTI